MIETKIVIQGYLMQMPVPQVRFLNRLRWLGVPCELIDAVMRSFSKEEYRTAESALLTWAQGEWHLPEDQIIEILNGRRPLLRPA